MKLLTAKQIEKLLANGRVDALAIEKGWSGPDHVPVVKLFTPDAGATWLITAMSEDGDQLYGLCDTGMGTPELGYVSLAELKALRGPFKLPVERDLHCTLDKPLSVYAEWAKTKGRIVLSMESH